ncbi:hypothetical protein GCM10025858_22340 [Alicyclobacillus sacchari]|nr:hypothetical protein GCM10025858_22340 [Alicyclobacillus sacchari]
MTKLALVSVYDKEGIIPFCEGLVRLGYQIISTGGTAKLLAERGIAVKPIDEHTGFPEMLDGRVKTLHPKVHGVCSRAAITKSTCGRYRFMALS